MQKKKKYLLSLSFARLGAKQPKGYVVRYNRTVSEIEEWDRKRVAYKIQKRHEGYYYFI